MDDGNDGSILPSDGDLDTPETREQAAKIENNINRRWYLPEEIENENERYSITARWSTRADHYKSLASAVQKWSEKEDPPPTADEELFAPYFAIGSLGNCAINSCQKCTVCKAVGTLKASYERFIESEKEHAAAKEEHAAAVNQLLSKGPSDQNDRSLLAKLVAAAANSVADKANSVADKANSVADKAKLVAAEAKLVAAAADYVFVRHREVESSLDALAAAGNGTALTTTENKTQTPESSNVSDKIRTDANFANWNPALSNYARLCKPMVIELSQCDFLTNLQGDKAEKLKELYVRLKDIFGKASMLKGGNAKSCERQQFIGNTVQGIMGVDVSEPMKQSKTQFCTPCCKGQENDGVQPILYAIMVKMVLVLGLGKHVIREQTISKLGNGVSRRVDFVMTSVEEYFYAILPAVLGVPIEVKPITRERSKVHHLLLEAQNQVIGHLAKRAIFSFGFGGVGEDCKVFGLELTMGSVAVIVLELSGVGTADVKVTTQRTHRMPLFDKKTRETMFGAEAKNVEESLETVEQEGMPAGFCLLARTLLSVQHGLGTSLISTSKGDHRTFPLCCRNANVTATIELGQFLGSGAFSHVLVVEKVEGSNNVDVFIKVPKSHQLRKSLENEAKVLKDLSEHSHIPQLYYPDDPIKILDFKIRCEVSKLPCLLLRGLIGQPTSQRRDMWKQDELKEIFLKVFTALTHANKKGWAHLDVRPANIITCAKLGDHPPGDRLEVMLIDWGCAYRNDEKVKGFVGCLPYAHDDLFGPSKEWQPRLDHDLASLAYSVVSLSLLGSIPWSGFSNHLSVTDDVKDERYGIATPKLCKLFGPQELLSLDFNAHLSALVNSMKGKRKQPGKEKGKRKRQ
jgi:Protein kinase domain